jgi:Domain of unknown function (DUF4129)
VDVVWEVGAVEARSRRNVDLTLVSGLAQRRTLALAALVAALTFLVGLGANRSLARVGGPRHGLDAGAVAGDLGLALFLAGMLVLGIVVQALWGHGRRRRRGEPELAIEEPERDWWEKPLALALALLPLALLVSVFVVVIRLGHPAQQLLPVRVPGRAGSSSRGRPPTAPRHEPAPAVHWWLWLLVAAAALALVLVTALVRRRAAASSPDDRLPVARDLQAVIEESLEDLEHEPDPRRAVIRAYAGMERALARRGLGRRPFEAPVEYLGRALGAIRVSGGAGRRLTGLFERARFSEHPIDEPMKRDAIGALAAVRDELAEQAR